MKLCLFGQANGINPNRKGWLTMQRAARKGEVGVLPEEIRNTLSREYNGWIDHHLQHVKTGTRVVIPEKYRDKQFAYKHCKCHEEKHGHQAKREGKLLVCAGCRQPLTYVEFDNTDT